MKSLLAVVVLALACAGLYFVPSAVPVAEDGGESLRAKVLTTDDAELKLAGVVEYGTQHLTV